MIHNVCEFSAIIQLAATFNLGCIALSGKGSFARSLANYFFKVQYFIDIAVSDMRKLIQTDLESMDKMHLLKIANKDYTQEADVLKNKFKSLKSDTESLFKEINETIDNRYIPKYLDSICLLLGIYSVCELVFAFFIKIGNSSFVFSFMAINIIISLITIIYLLCETANYLVIFHNVKILKKCRVEESKTSIILAIASAIISILFPHINKLFRPLISCTDTITTIHFYIGLLLPFIGFIIYWLYIELLSHKAKSLINEKLTPIRERFESLHHRKTEIDVIITEFSNSSIIISNSELSPNVQHNAGKQRQTSGNNGY